MVENKKISLSDDRPREEYDFLDGFVSVQIPEKLAESKLGVKVLGIDHELGDRTFGRPIEALVGYAIANERYATHAKALPPMQKIIELRVKLKEDIQTQFNLDIPLDELELHILYEFSQ